MKRLGLAGELREIVLRHTEERRERAAGCLLTILAVAVGDERRILVEREFDRAAGIGPYTSWP